MESGAVAGHRCKDVVRTLRPDVRLGFVVVDLDELADVVLKPEGRAVRRSTKFPCGEFREPAQTPTQSTYGKTPSSCTTTPARREERTWSSRCAVGCSM